VGDGGDESDSAGEAELSDQGQNWKTEIFRSVAKIDRGSVPRLTKVDGGSTNYYLHPGIFQKNKSLNLNFLKKQKSYMVHGSQIDAL
jgi:hypothetical protein